MVRRFAGIWLLLLIPLYGCQGGSLEFLPVSGKVTYQGTPLHAGLIVFTPDATHGGHGEMAMAEIREDGSYSLRTGKSFGVVAGWYRVTVASISPDTASLPGQRYQVPSTLLPERYRDPELSRLVCEVKAERANNVDFDLD